MRPREKLDTRSRAPCALSPTQPFPAVDFVGNVTQLLGDEKTLRLSQEMFGVGQPAERAHNANNNLTAKTLGHSIVLIVRQFTMAPATLVTFQQCDLALQMLDPLAQRF
jgi:hypothetical protein